MVIIESYNVINIICKALNRVDKRLINHGERVAYIILKMLQCENKLTKPELQKICLLAVMHDIGAYKTDEIDRLVEFETSNIWQHSVYGYLFLKKLSPLADLADAILYHHLPYEKFSEVECRHKKLAMIFSLVDRIDIYMENNNFVLEEKAKTAFKSTHFSPDALELFYKANDHYGILENIKSGSYKEELKEYLKTCEFPDGEIDSYLKMLALTIDFRSQATALHTIMTVNISVEIGRMMKLDEYWSDAVYYGSLLHDIGKISTPLSILENTGKLTYDEMQIMKQHVSVSEEIIKDFINEDICNIAIRHHEKLDGSGYAYGLTAEQLTMCQRAVAVADILSALVGVRSYKKVFSKERTLEIINDMASNNKICKEIVSLVLENFDEIIENAQKRSKTILEVYSSISDEYEPLFLKCSAI